MRLCWCQRISLHAPHACTKFCIMLTVTRILQHSALRKFSKYRSDLWYKNFVKMHSFSRTLGELLLNSAETATFHKISTSENLVKFLYFTQCRNYMEIYKNMEKCNIKETIIFFRIFTNLIESGER